MGKAAGIGILVLGIVILGAGFGIDYYATNLVVEQLPDALMQVRDEGLPAVKPSVYEDYTDDLLLGALEEVNETIGGEENLAGFVNGSTFLQVLYQSLVQCMTVNTVDMDTATGMFFNDQTYNEIIMGISTVITSGASSLGFGPAAIATIMGGNTTTAANATFAAIVPDMAGLPMPGISEVYNDFIPGCLIFIQIIEGVDGSPYEGAVSNCYGGADFDNQLVPVKTYLVDYIFENVVPALLMAGTGLPDVPKCTTANALDFIKLQWATMLLLPDGLVELEPAADGFEANSTEWDSFAQIMSLWNETDDLALTYDGAGGAWYAALTGDTDKEDELKDHFSLSDDLWDDLMDWYGGRFETLVKYGVNDELGISGDPIYDRIFYAQWSYNVLDDLEALYEDDEDEKNNIYGFEIEGLTAETAIPYETCADLWDEENVNSFLTLDGCKKWLAAGDDQEGAEYEELMAEFDLTEAQMKAVSDWIVKWRDVTLPALGAAMGELPELPLYGTDVTKLRNDSGFYLPIAGGIIAALGIVLLLMSKSK